MITLADTSGGAVASAIAAERRRLGSGATGMVLTLLIISDEAHQAEATNAAVGAARSHPMRILTLIPDPDAPGTGLDAEISVGGEDGPGEVAVLRLRGELAAHANSVAVPLLLPDTPVVAFWPAEGPATPSDDLLGRHAQRRITDARRSPDPMAALRARGAGYIPGDTDLVWARLTPWRSALAAVLDRPLGPVHRIHLHGPAHDPGPALLSTWLRDCLHAPADLTNDADLTCVELHTASGVVRIARRPNGHATLEVPGSPDAIIALPERGLASLLSEELRRLDPDDIYARTLAHCLSPTGTAETPNP